MCNLCVPYETFVQPLCKGNHVQSTTSNTKFFEVDKHSVYPHHLAPSTLLCIRITKFTNRHIQYTYRQTVSFTKVLHKKVPCKTLNLKHSILFNLTYLHFITKSYSVLILFIINPKVFDCTFDIVCI